MSTAVIENSRRLHPSETAFRVTLLLAAMVVLITLAGILAVMFEGGALAFERFGVSFLWRTDWDPVRDLYGALPAVTGTIATALIAVMLAWPVGFGIAYFLAEIAPRYISQPVGVAIELLAAIPSIVYGIWGFFVFAPVMASTIEPWITEHTSWLPLLPSEDNPMWFWFQGAPIGAGLLTGGLVLAIMIIPFIAAATRDVLMTTPQLLKDGGYALGATRWEVLTGVVIPAVRGSLFGAVFLGLGRALGETMAVAFTIGNANRMPTSFFDPATSIAALVANEFPDSAQGSLKMASLMALGFILFVVSFGVLAIARVLFRQERMT